MLEELAFFEASSGNVIGIATRDLVDKDFGGIVMAKDRKLCFRSVDVTAFSATPAEARETLFAAMLAAAAARAEDHHQGDEEGRPVDFFTHVHEGGRLHPSFVRLSTEEGYTPARELIESMMRWHEDADGNFVEQFQTTGFDQRIWELYLFAMLIEAGYELDREINTPDFCCRGLQGSLFVEAVTVGPTRKDGKIVPPPATETVEALEPFLKHYMPIKFGSALYSKLKKKYWEQEHVAGQPFVLAVADFSGPMSMVLSKSALERYLLGYEQLAHKDAYGNLMMKPERIGEHTWEGKTVPSGFFRLPDAENVSAVISTTAGTIAKFNRLGVLGRFGSKRVLLTRTGTMVNHDPNATHPQFFKVIVNSAGYEENWIEGLNVYHNRDAKIPLPMHMLPGAAHHHCDKSGLITSFTPELHPIASTTEHFVPVNVDEILAKVGDQTHAVYTPRLDGVDEVEDKSHQ